MASFNPQGASSNPASSNYLNTMPGYHAMPGYIAPDATRYANVSTSVVGPTGGYNSVVPDTGLTMLHQAWIPQPIVQSEGSSVDANQISHPASLGPSALELVLSGPAFNIVPPEQPDTARNLTEMSHSFSRSVRGPQETQVDAESRQASQEKKMVHCVHPAGGLADDGLESRFDFILQPPGWQLSVYSTHNDPLEVCCTALQAYQPGSSALVWQQIWSTKKEAINDLLTQFELGEKASPSRYIKWLLERATDLPSVEVIECKPSEGGSSRVTRRSRIPKSEPATTDDGAFEQLQEQLVGLAQHAQDSKAAEELMLESPRKSRAAAGSRRHHKKTLKAEAAEAEAAAAAATKRRKSKPPEVQQEQERSKGKRTRQQTKRCFCSVASSKAVPPINKRQTMAAAAKASQAARYWSSSEHKVFLAKLNEHGRGEWIAIARYIKSKTPDQVRSHAQKYFLSLENGKSMYKKTPGPRPMDEVEDDSTELELHEQPKSDPKKRKKAAKESTKKKPPKRKDFDNSSSGDLYGKVYNSGKARRLARNQVELGDENELGDWTTLQCGLINADWKTADGRKNNGLDPLIKYWIKPDVQLKSSAQVRTQDVFEGDQALRDYLKEHPEHMPDGLGAPKKDYLALLF